MNVSEHRARVELNPLRPHSFFIEPERSESGEIVSIATVFLTNRECPWQCIYCDLWKNTLTETVPPGAIPAQIDYALTRLWKDEFHEFPSAQNETRADHPSNADHYPHFRSTRDTSASGFPLPSTGRGIEGEGWERPAPSLTARANTVPPLTPALSPLRGEGEGHPVVEDVCVPGPSTALGNDAGNDEPADGRQIKLYNAGSFFDAKAIPPEDFAPIAERVCQFDRVIVECHPALVGDSALRFRDLLNVSCRHSSSASTLEVAMGLEIADDHILAKLNKQMTLEMFARAARFLRKHDIAVRAFVMVKPPFVNREEQALQFALHSIDFAFDCGATVVSLIPARFGTAELKALAERGDFAPPKLATLEAALDYGVALRRGRVFADLWDLEKFADCSSCFAERRERLSEMNLQQIVLPRSECRVCAAPRCEPARTAAER